MEGTVSLVYLNSSLDRGKKANKSHTIQAAANAQQCLGAGERNLHTLHIF